MRDQSSQAGRGRCAPQAAGPLARSGALPCSRRTFPVVRVVHLPVERSFYEFDGIDCRTKLSAKFFDGFFHRRWQISPPVNDLTHRFFDGAKHVFCCNVTVRSCHGAARCSSQVCGSKRHFPIGTVSFFAVGVSARIKLRPESVGAIRRNRCGRAALRQSAQANIAQPDRRNSAPQDRPRPGAGRQPLSDSER